MIRKYLNKLFKVKKIERLLYKQQFEKIRCFTKTELLKRISNSEVKYRV